MKKAKRIKQLKEQVEKLRKLVAITATESTAFYNKNIQLQLKIDEMEENQALIDELQEKNKDYSERFMKINDIIFDLTA